MSTTSWAKILVVTSFLAGGLVLFDLQITPFLMRMAHKLHKVEAQKKQAEVPPLPKEIAHRTWSQVPIEPESDFVPVTILSQPQGAMVMFNDKLVGETPFHGSTQRGEKLAILVSLPAYESVTREIKPESSKPLRYMFSLFPQEEEPRVHMKTKKDYSSTDALVSDDLQQPKKTKLPPMKIPITPPEVRGSPIKAELNRLKPKRLALPPEPKTKPRPLAAKKKDRQSKVLKTDEFYTVQVDSLQDPKEATYKVALYQAMGHKAFICSAEVKQRGTWYRVRIGRFKTMKQAKALAKKLTPDLKSKPWITFEDGLCPQLVSATPWEKI